MHVIYQDSISQESLGPYPPTPTSHNDATHGWVPDQDWGNLSFSLMRGDTEPQSWSRNQAWAHRSPSRPLPNPHHIRDFRASHCGLAHRLRLSYQSHCPTPLSRSPKSKVCIPQSSRSCSICPHCVRLMIVDTWQHSPAITCQFDRRAQIQTYPRSPSKQRSL